MSILFSVVIYSFSYATHNRAGEITFKQTGALSIEATIYTYTKIQNTSVDRDSLELFWGDGTSSFVRRVNGDGAGEIIGQDVRLNIYVATHTYPGRGNYTMGFEDPNRIGGILNVNWPSSVEVRFFLSATVTLLDPQFDGTNSSVQLLQAPIDQACVGEIFIHNPNAFDPDGDSLSYELVAPMSSATEAVPNYKYPNEISPSSENNITLNPITGEFIWNAPQIEGEYNIAIRINEWRNGRIISSVTRDMQIFVAQCDNKPPTIETVEELCVIAGEKIELDVLVNDPDEGQKVILTASGAPFVIEDNQATLSLTKQLLSPPFTSTFFWQTNCNHVSDKYYQIVLKASDNYFTDSVGLTTQKTLRIKVVAPPPTNLLSTATNNSVRLTWGSPYTCEATDNSFFQGFSVWKKRGSDLGILPECETGLDKLGFIRIAFNTKTQDDGKYVFVDEDIAEEGVYCYRVQADFAYISATGIPYNRIASLPSEQVCRTYRSDLPLMTKVSVSKTNENNGIIDIAWELPVAEILDTLKNPGPYTYELYHEVNSTIDLVQTYTSTYFNETIPQTYRHFNIDTKNEKHTYFVKFYTANGEYGNSAKAGSIFLSTTPTDQKLSLSWNVDVPWSNSFYYIIDTKSNERIDSTQSTEYTIEGLENGREYCYIVQSKGRYINSHYTETLTNDSQVSCAKPNDDIAPCPPTLQVTNICENADAIDELVNTLSFAFDTNDCIPANDLRGFKIYFSTSNDGDFTEIATIDYSDDLTYDHRTDMDLAGCYAVAAIDASGNIGTLSNTVCVDNCPLYELPNTFTPNGDGSNDLFTPTTNRFILQVTFQVFNEWGNKVWSTSVPELNWDGTSSGKALPEGVYYYTCTVFIRSTDGVQELENTLSGYINLIR